MKSSRHEIALLNLRPFQKSVYTFFEALAICHTVQVAGSYEEDEDRAEEELNILNVNAEIPPIFHKSIEDLNDVESIEEEIDFISMRQTVTFEHRRGSHQNGNTNGEEIRPHSDTTPQKPRRESLHKRPSSLSNIQVQKTSDLSMKHIEFSMENPLLKRVQQQEYKRAVSHHVDGEVTQKEVATHRRTKSHIPFGSAGKQSSEVQKITQLK